MDFKTLKEQTKALRFLLDDKSLTELREKLIGILARHADRDITMIECVAIKDIFEVGMESISSKVLEKE